MLKKVNALTDEILMQQIINLIQDHETTKQEGVDIFDASCA
jgi:hypothetical protein